MYLQHQAVSQVVADTSGFSNSDATPELKPLLKNVQEESSKADESAKEGTSNEKTRLNRISTFVREFKKLDFIIYLDLNIF